MIVLDAAAVPDGYSGARTRLRGLLAAYARVGVMPFAIRIVRGSSLLAGVELGSIRVEEVAAPGGPGRRAIRLALGRRALGALAQSAKLWHSETIPPLGPKHVPALLTLHDLRWIEPRSTTGAPWSRWAPRHAFAKWRLPSVARSCAGIVTVSEASAKRIVAALDVEPARVHVVPNATVIEPAPRLAVDEEGALLERLGVRGRPFFLAVGHLEPRKGLALAIDALSRSRAGVVASTKLVFVGEGPGASALRARARGLGIDERVAFAGSLDERATASLYASAAALLFPSRYEGFGLPVHEARAHGCPVLAHELPPIEELVGEDVELLGDEVSAWSSALERLAASSRHGTGSTSARSAPRVSITWDDAARRLSEVYLHTLHAR